MLRKLLVVFVIGVVFLSTYLITLAASPGDPLPGLTPAQLAAFNIGKEQFQEVVTPADGQGPVFNEKQCSVCHNIGGIGGAGVQQEVRAGRLVNGVFDPLANLGGSLFQLRGIDGAVPGCNVTGESVPPQANVMALRQAIPIFGDGLVDATPDSTFMAIAASQPAAIRGRVAMVFNISAGRNTVGKFGWKAQNPTLFQFSGDAYLNEMGITNPQFPNENAPQGNPALLAACDKVPDPEDDGTDVQRFTDFMTLLAPPPRGPIGLRERAGDVLFTRFGCDQCHIRNITSGPSPIAALSNKTYHPFGDFLLHDMGSLNDQIGQAGASPFEMRTIPLWGLRFRNPSDLLHDGRANSIRDAIVRHDGQGAAARNAFLAAISSQQEDLITFLRSL